MIETVVREGLRTLRGRPSSLPLSGSQSTPFDDLMTISVERAYEAEGQSHVRVDVPLGRAFWLASIQTLVSGRAFEALLGHKWSIVEPSDGEEWPLTDHPALKLNYRSPAEYDLGGGWGRRNGNLMLPLTPRHLLFAEIGKDLGRRYSVTPAQTREIRRLILERAHRWVFASSPSPLVAKLTPRVVDRERFDQESAMWKRWSSDQRESEVSRRTLP